MNLWGLLLVVGNKAAYTHNPLWGFPWREDETEEKCGSFGPSGTKVYKLCNLLRIHQKCTVRKHLLYYFMHNMHFYCAELVGVAAPAWLGSKQTTKENVPAKDLFLQEVCPWPSEAEPQAASTSARGYGLNGQTTLQLKRGSCTTPDQCRDSAHQSDCA